jgi:hypothetical protein
MPNSAPTQPRRPRFAPGIFACKRAVVRLTEFRDLVAHDQRWGGHFQQARPLTELLPPGTPRDRQHLVVEQVINKRIPSTWVILHNAGIPTDVAWTDNRLVWDYDAKDTRPRNKRSSADLVADYFQVLRDDQNGELFEMLIHVLDQSVGYYDDMQKRAWKRKYNPLDWIAYVFSLPVRILDRAGLLREPTPSTGMAIFEWILRIVFAAILLFGAYLGMKIPEAIWQLIVK